MPQNFPQDFFQGSQPIALVAGGAGFVGSHVCEALLFRRVGVICVDNWRTGVEENIKHLKEYPNFFLLEQDIAGTAEKIPEGIERLDYVLHVAGIEAYLNGEDVSVETLEANSTGSKNLLEVAKKYGARFLLASTINVFSGQISPFSHTEAKRFAEALTSEYGQKRGVNVRIVRLGDVYGPRMMLSSGSAIAKLIKEVLYKQDLVVPQEAFVFPVYIDDVVEGIVKALLSSGTKGSIVSLAGPKTSIFSVAQIMKQTIEGSGDLVFKKGEFQEVPNDEKMLTAGQDIISWQPKVSLEEGVAKTLDWFSRNRNKIPAETEPERREVRINKKRSGNFWSDIKVGGKGRKLLKRNKWLGLAAILLGLFWFFVLPFLEVGAGLLQLNLAKKAVFAGNYSSTEAWSGRARVWLGWSKAGFSRWENLPFIGKKAYAFEDGSRILIQAAEISRFGARLLEDLSQLFENVQGRAPASGGVVVDSRSSDLRTLEEKIAFLEADMGKEIDAPPFVGQKVLSQHLDLSTLRKASGVLANILPQTPDLLGGGGKKTYLVLFQNNATLRPGGGLIGSYALVTFNAGKLVSFDVQDVSAADGQLKGHVEPPLPIKDYLGEANWFLRDSNWSPDFPTSAERAAWFIDKELGVKIDGVIAIDLEFTKRLFNELGLTGYQSVPVWVLSEEANDFSVDLARQLLQLVTSLPKERLTTLGKVALSSLEGRHFSIWTDNEEADLALKRAGWDGSLLDASCGASCTGDYLQVVEANLGGNKSNVFVARTESLELSMDDQKVSHSLAVSYANDSGSSSIGGNYKNYIRIFTSLGSIPGKAYLLDPATGFQEELNLDVGQEKGKEVFGTLLTIPANQSRTINFWWDTPIPLGNKELSLVWQKQAGTLNDPAWIKINPPKGRSFTASPEPSLTIQGAIGYNIPLSKDIKVNVKWQQ
ncbi:MAG: NAD-dependent epimerase/dehydratase family protein [bacterium]|nr:NAD-dependent epimerase/dehydratase family protein [bacterium]